MEKFKFEIVLISTGINTYVFTIETKVRDTERAPHTSDIHLRADFGKT